MRRPLILMAALMAATVLLVSGVAYALSVQCDGPTDQDPLPGQCQGTAEDDFINGTAQADLILALGGFDLVAAGVGKDTLDGGINGDELRGGEDRDMYTGGPGADHLTEYRSISDNALSGNDVMKGGDGPDHMEGNEGNDVLKGQAGDEHCVGCTFFDAEMFGDPGDDELYGGGGEDGMQGEEGSDLLNGGPGDDFLDAADEETVGTPDTVDGGDDFDVCIVNQNDTVANCEATQTVANPTAASAASSKEDTTNR